MDSTELQQRYKKGDRNFQDIVMANADLAWFELQGVDLRNADLSRSNLSGANLQEANLSGGTNLSFADLSRSDLSNANLRGSNLQGANLSGAILDGAVYDENTQFPIGFDPQSVGAIAGGQLRQPDATLTETPEQAAGSEVDPTSPDEDLSQYATQAKPRTSQRDRTTRKVAAQRSQRAEPASSSLDLNFAEVGDAVKNVALKVKANLQQASQRLQEVNRESRPSPQSPQVLVSADGAKSLSGRGNNSVVPSEVKGWNWGAFLLPFFWFISNKVWGGVWLWLLMFIPGINGLAALVYALVFGFSGNEYAWKARQWQSIAEFKRHQRYWAIAGFLLWGMIFLPALFSSS